MDRSPAPISMADWRAAMAPEPPDPWEAMLLAAEERWASQTRGGGPGIYFLFSGKRLIYIGQSIRVWDRVAQHWRYGQRGAWSGKDFSAAFARACPKWALNEVEATLISWFAPPRNFRDPEWAAHVNKTWRKDNPKPFVQRLITPVRPDRGGDVLWRVWGERAWCGLAHAAGLPSCRIKVDAASARTARA